MKARSPIEMMVDKACGFNPDEVPQKSIDQQRTEALVNLANAAIKWATTEYKDDVEQLTLEFELIDATQKLIDAGW